MAGLKTLSVIIDGRYYRVMPFPYDDVASCGIGILRKGIAYQIDTMLTKGLFPYRGVIGRKESLDKKTAKVGVYMKEVSPGQYEMRLVRPRTKKEKEEYALGRERNVVSGIIEGKIDKSELLDMTLTPTNGTDDIYLPPIRPADDPLNRLMKLAIRLKGVPFGPYGKRLEALAVDRSSSGGSNTKNNHKRGLDKNTAMSSSKYMTFARTFEFETAFILRDAPNSTHPMLEPGKMLVLYPSGPAFEISQENLVDARDLIWEAIQDSKTLEEDESTETKKRKKKEDK